MELIKASWVKGLICGIIVLLFNAHTTQAQTFAEWFRQKKTLIKYLSRQIAALEEYGSYIKQGNQIAQNGLGHISGFIKGEYNLHTGYYYSLKTVNPVIKSNPKADSIMACAKQITAQFDYLNELSGLDNSNRQYMAQVKAKVLDECDQDLAELQLLISPSQTQMTDDTRIKRLDQLYIRLKDTYAFSQSFSNQVKMLLFRRNQELQDSQTLKQTYGIN